LHDSEKQPYNYCSLMRTVKNLAIITLVYYPTLRFRARIDIHQEPDVLSIGKSTFASEEVLHA